MAAHVVGVAVREEEPRDLARVDADPRERVGEHRVVGRRDAAVDQRRGLAAEQVRPQRGVGDGGVVGGDAEDPVGHLGRLAETHRLVHRIIPMKGYHAAVTGS